MHPFLDPQQFFRVPVVFLEKEFADFFLTLPRIFPVLSKYLGLYFLSLVADNYNVLGFHIQVHTLQ